MHCRLPSNGGLAVNIAQTQRPWALWHIICNLAAQKHPWERQLREPKATIVAQDVSPEAWDINTCIAAIEPISDCTLGEYHGVEDFSLSNALMGVHWIMHARLEMIFRHLLVNPNGFARHHRVIHLFKAVHP